MKDDDSKFADLIPGVKRLHSDRINVFQEREKRKLTIRHQVQENTAASAHVIDTSMARDTKFNPGIQKKLERKIRQGLIRPSSSLDLHGYRQSEALEVLNEFIADALARNERMVIVIHGQGYRSKSEAVLKPLVQRWLAGHSAVLAWCPAQPRDGAGGASYVYLRTA